MLNGLYRKNDRLRLDLRDADIIERKNGGGYLIFFGIPFFLTGLLATLNGLGCFPNREEVCHVSALSSALFGIIFMGVGLVLAFGRSGLTIDRRRNHLIEWEWMIFPLKRAVHPLDQFNGIRLHCCDREKAKTYLVQLSGESPSSFYTVEETPDYPQARRTAEALSSFLGKPLLN